jgi:hypothetical protein
VETKFKYVNIKEIMSKLWQAFYVFKESTGKLWQTFYVLKKV